MSSQIRINPENFVSGFILFASAMVFPLYFLNPFTYYKTVQMLFTLSSISAICLAIIFFKAREVKDQLIKRHPIIFTFICLFLAITITQYFVYKTYTLSELGFSIIWVTVPIFGYLYSDILKRQLPIYFFIFLLFDLLISTTQANEAVGIAGNRNWHAVFLILLNAFTLYFAYDIYKKLSGRINKTCLLLLLCAVFGTTTMYSSYIVLICRCKAAILSLAVAVLMILFLEIYRRNRKVFTAILVLVMILLGVIFVINKFSKTNLPSTSTIALKIQANDKAVIQKVNTTVTRDVRFPLWEGCIDLIMKYPYLGVSTARFESVFAEFRPIEYFMKPDNAVRSNHPHNSFLYIAACYGIPGLCLWLILWGLPIIICIRKYYELTLISKVVLFCYIILFLHAQLDLIFFEWPTVLFSAILLGIIWNEIWMNKIVNNNTLCKCIHSSNFSDKAIFLTLKLVAIVIILLSIKMVYIALASTYYFRLGEIAESDNYKEQALYYYDKGIKLDKNPQYIYRSGALSFQDLAKPHLALRYFLMFKNITITNYAHSNGFTGLTLIKLNRIKESLPYLLKEVIIYPLLAGSWYRICYIQKLLGMKDAAQLSYNNLKEVMKYKNLPPKALHLLLENPEYDSHPDRIPQSALAKLQE